MFLLKPRSQAGPPRLNSLEQAFQTNGCGQKGTSINRICHTAPVQVMKRLNSLNLNMLSSMMYPLRPASVTLNAFFNVPTGPTFSEQTHQKTYERRKTPQKNI